MKIKEASDIEEKLNEVERLLKNAINMPCKVSPSIATLHIISPLKTCSSMSWMTKTYAQYSRSEVMLTFFERSPLDQVLRNDKVHRIQPCCQSPIKISGADLRASCDTKLLMTSRCRPDFIADPTLWTFLRNHAVQRILPGQHRNHCIWSQSPWRKRETLLHWLSGTHVSMKTTPQCFCLRWPLIRKILEQMTLLVSANIS